MAITKTEAIVLKTFDFRETSRIAHFFSVDYGRINGILKGIRKDPRKFASTLEPFSCNEIIFYPSRSSSLHLVSHCDLKHNFSRIRQDLKAFAYASYLTELLAKLLPLEEKNPEVYNLAFSSLEEINVGQDSEKVLRVFLIRLLKLIGFRPRVDECVSCGKDAQGEVYFNYRRGGLLCRTCNKNDIYSSGILGGTIASMLHLEAASWQEALRLGLNQKVKEELNQLLRSFMEFHLQLKPVSGELLEVFK